MAEDLDYLLSWKPGQPLQQPAATGENLSGTYENFSYKERLKDPLYLADIREYFAERGITDKTDEELDTLLHNDANYRDLNTIAPFFGVRGSQSDIAKNSKTNESLRRVSRLHQVMQNAPSIFSEDGRTLGEAGPSIAGAIVTDPVNWALGAVEAASGGSATPLVAGARAATAGGRSALMSGVARGAVRAGRFGAAEGAVTGALADLGQQGIEQQVGLSDETSVSRVVESAAAGAALSGVLGGAFGAAGGAFAGRRGGRLVEGLKAKGYTDDEIGNVIESGEKGLEFLQQNEPDIYRQMIEDEKRAAEEALGEPSVDPIEKANQLADEMRGIRIASQLGPLEEHLRDLRSKLTSLRADNETGVDGVGVLDDQINETLSQIANLEEARLFPKSIERRQKMAEELLADPDANKRITGREMMMALAEDRAKFEEVVSSNVPEDISDFITGRVSNAQALEEGRRFTREDGSLDEAARRAALKERQKTVAGDARQMAQAEGVVAKNTGELAARTDSATKNQARLTQEQVSSADAENILEEDYAKEAEAVAAELEAKAAQADGQQPAAAAEAGTATPEDTTAKSEEQPAADQAQAAQPGKVQPAMRVGAAATDAEPAQPVKLPVTKSNKKSKVKASTAAKKMAIERGVDLEEVKGTGQDGRILATDIQSHVETNGASDTFQNALVALGDVAEDMAMRLDVMGVSEDEIARYLANPQTFGAALRKYNRDVLGGVYDEDAIASLLDVYESQIARGDGSTFNAPSFKDKAEQSEYYKRVANYVLMGRSEREAHLTAAIDLANERKASFDKTKVDPRMIGAANPSSTLGRMDNASPIPVDEKGNPLIRLQSLLRNGRVFKDKTGGADYSITDKAPHVASFGYDKAMTHAKRAYETAEKIKQLEIKAGRQFTDEEISAGRTLRRGEYSAEFSALIKERGNTRSPVYPFVSNGFTRVRDAKGKPAKGSILYVSGRTGKAYADWRNAYADIGLPIKGDQQPKSLVDVLGTLKKSTSKARVTDEAGMQKAMKIAGQKAPVDDSGLSFDDFLQALAETSTDATLTKTAPVSRTDLPELERGGKRAFFINKETGEVRSPSDKQLTEGKTAASILGKSDPKNWTVEYHDKTFSPSKSGLQRARGTYEERLTKKVEASSVPPKAVDFQEETFSATHSPRLTKAVSALNQAIQRVAGTPGVDTFFGLLTLNDNFTGKDLLNISDMAHRLPLSGVNKHSLAMMKAIAEVEKVIAPAGLRKAEQLRDQAISDVKSIFAKLPSDVVTPMVDLISSLADGQAPKVALTRALPDMAFEANTGTVLIPENITQQAIKHTVPPSFTFFHEIGHWAHMNLLSADDRVEFWDWAVKNLPDQEAVRGQLGIPAGQSIGGDIGRLADYLTAYYSSPAEFFAESFARWATGQIESAGNPQMWQRFMRYIKGIFDTVIGRKPSTDRDLEKLFLKILPDAKAEEIAENLDAIKGGATPIEVIEKTTPVAGLREPTIAGTSDGLDGGQSLAARPDYMSLPLDDLLEMGDDARNQFITKLKQVSDNMRLVDDLWDAAGDTLDPETAFEAYRETQRLLIGSTTSLEQKRKYLQSVAKAKKVPLESLYSSAEEAFYPFRQYLDIVPRANKMRRRLSLARTGSVQAMAENQLADTVPDVISDAEAIEAGLVAGADPSKAAASLMSLFMEEKTGLRRLLLDMQTALNTAYEQTGLIPQTDLVNEKTAPRELVTHQIGRFQAVTIGDVFRTKAEKDMTFVVEDISGDDVVLRASDGQVRKLAAAEFDAYSRVRQGKSALQIEETRAARLAQARALRADLLRKRIDEARRIASGKIALRSADLEANPGSASAKELPQAILVKRIGSNTDLEGDAADELISREAALPILPVKVVPTPIEEARAAIRNMRAKMLDGDATVDNDVAAFPASRVQLSPRNRQVNLAIKREIEETRGVGSISDTGIPPTATPQLTDLLSSIDHRNRRVKYTARKMLYRAIRMGHPEVDDVPNADAFLPETEAWKSLRSRVRSLAEVFSGAGGRTDNILERTTSLVYETNPIIKSQLDDLGYTSDDAAELLASVLGEIDRPIESGERKLASDLLDAVGYLTNGLIHNEPLRKGLHRLTYFNDLFSDRRAATPDANSLSNLTMAEAARFATGSITPSSLGIDASVLSRQGYNDLVLVRSDGRIVASPYDGVKSLSDLAARAMKKSPKASGKATKDMSEIGDAFYGGGLEGRKVVVAVAKKADGVRDLISRTTEQAQLTKLRAILDDHLGLLEENGVDVPRFTVMAVKARTPFNTATVIDNPKMLQAMRDGVSEAVEDGDIPATVGTAVDRTLAAFRLGQNGETLYRELSEVLTDDFTADDMIAALGYDSIRNKFGQVSKVFNKDQMAPVDQFMGSHFYAPSIPFDESLDNPIGGQITASMMVPPVALDRFSAPAAFRVAKKVDDNGLKHWLLNLGRNRLPKRSDAITPIRMKHKWLGTNSARMRSGGMVTLGDWFEGHFPWVQQDFARRLIGTRDEPGPLRVLRSLPDAPSRLKRHMANSTGRTLKVESHGKILNALIEPSNPRHEAKLTEMERSALKVIRDGMTKAFLDLRGAGVMMGNRGKNFFPQIWSQTAVRKDPEAAIEGFAKYFEIEALHHGAAVDKDAFKKRATNVVARLAEVDDQSIWEPGVIGTVTGAAENLDYSRKIELDRHPEALRYLKPFLEDDLETYLVKYFDQVSHRMSMANKFGHRNHAFGDYLAVVARGRDGIAELLQQKRTQEHNTYAFTPEDGLLEVSFTESYPMPFESDPYRAVEAANEVIDIHRKAGPEMARRYLLALAKPDESRKGKPSVVYERRVGAIVDALRDFNGETKNISMMDAKFLTNSMKVASRRPLIGDTTYMVKAAKNLRAFNSITLLSYTTIASLGDAFLPIVRSGDMRSTMRAWGKYMGDPDYREAMRNVGTSIESLLHNRMTHMTGTPANRFTSAFFNATGLTPWTDEARSIATAVGLEAFKTAQKKALASYNPAIPPAAQNTTFRQNFRFLKRYGLESFATTRQSIEAPEVLNTDTVRVGLMRFVDESVFSPNPNDIPIHFQTPWGAVLFQLKSFPLMMQRMAKEVLFDDLRLALNDKMGRPFDLSDVRGTGNAKRAAYLLTLMPVVGYGVNSIMDVVRGRGGEEGDERRPVDRTMSQYVRQLPGFDEDYQMQFGELGHIKDRESLDAFVGQYLSGFMTAAGLGLVASMLSDAASQAENGTFGTERMLSTVLGPSIGTGVSAWHVAQGVLDGNDRSSYPERQALRETARRIPVLGGQQGVVEDLVDLIAPPNKKGGSAKNQKPKLFLDD